MYHVMSNNRASFHLCCKVNLIKHQKVSKYCENDCRPFSNYSVVKVLHRLLLLHANLRAIEIK